ncbi:natural cytotoxicity triggering receptor 3 ligand 1-like [Pyxicephalus adspersus]|uniref:natural cytotoxicity triggering receptor 3 ligand 1-like n=1 Tax=Pyxicephalus adspersus TaxID=30357 RepID=UPI003B59675F
MEFSKWLGEGLKLCFECLMILLLISPLKAAIHIEKMPSPIKAQLGQNVTIPCLLTYDDNQELDLNLTTVGIRWSKITSRGSESNVYVFVNLGHEQYRPGSFIDGSQLKRGNASLTLQHLQKSDEGEYICTVISTPYLASAKAKVQLLAQPMVSLSSTQVIIEPGTENNVTCKVTQFYPEAVQIRWKKYTKGSSIGLPVDRDIYFTGPEENSDGTFNATSLLTVRPSSLEEDGDVYSCTVTHMSFSHDETLVFILTVKEPSTYRILNVGGITSIILLVIIIALLCVIFWGFQGKKQADNKIHKGDIAHSQRRNIIEKGDSSGSDTGSDKYKRENKINQLADMFNTF